MDEPDTGVTDAYFKSIHAKPPGMTDRHMEPMSKVRSLTHGMRLIYNMGVNGVLSSVINRARYAAPEGVPTT